MAAATGIAFDQAMNPFGILLAQAGLLLSGSAAIEAARDGTVEAAIEAPGGRTMFEAATVRQVRIEQQVTIRIAPRAPVLRPQLFTPFPDDEDGGPRFVERKMGKCLPLGGIVGVQDGGKNRLILFLRDRRIVSATLEKACRARDFYSGFYVAKNDDGMLCVDRDQLQARSGANCQLSGIRQLVEVDG